MNKKSVYIITDLYPPAFSPRIYSIVKTLKNNGFDVFVFTEEQKKHLIFKSYKDICPTYRFNLLGNNIFKRTIKRIAEFISEYKESLFVSNIKKTIKRNNICRPDIVLCFCYRKFPIKTSYKISRFFNVPFIADCRDIAEQQNKFININFGFNLTGYILKKLIIRQRNKYLKKANTITTVSKWHKYKISSYMPYKNIELIYNGYDCDLFTPKDIKCDDFNIIFTGRIMDKQFRDPTILLQAVKELEQECRGIKLKFYTDRESTKIIKSTNSKIKCNLQIFDFVDHKCVPDLLNSSSMIAIISSSKKYGGGCGMITTKIFEALAMNKPLILFSDTESEAATIVRLSERGIATDNKEEIKEFIKQQYNVWEKYGLCKADKNKDFVSNFNREKQNMKMIGTINKILNNVR